MSYAPAMTEPEITALAIPLLRLCDRRGRSQVAMLAIGMWLSTFPDAEAAAAMDDLVRELQRGGVPSPNRC